MTDHRRKLIRRIAAVLGALMLLVPVSLEPSEGVTTTDVCATGVCCSELMSICTDGTNSQVHYYKDYDGVCDVQTN